MDFILTESMQQTIQQALNDLPTKYSEEAKQVIQANLNPPYPVSYELLIEVSKKTDVYLHELLKNSAVYIKPKEIKLKNPAFEAYMNQLREEEEKKKYNAMVGSVLSSDEQKFNMGISHNEIKEIKHHIATIFNIGFSMIAVFMAVYKVSHVITHDDGMQILLSLGGALFICVVEVILYLKYAYTIIPKKSSNKVSSL